MTIHRIAQARRERIVQMALSGRDVHDIAHKCGLKADTVRRVLYAARDEGTIEPPTRRYVSFRLPDTAFTVLQHEADARQISPQALARQIISVVIEDNLFLAVLDKS